MSSPGRRRGNFGHAMAIFLWVFCARCRHKGKDPCVDTPDAECKFCIVLTPEQKAQLATRSYKLQKKREAKKLESSSTPVKDGTLVDPSTMSVIGAVSDTGSVSVFETSKVTVQVVRAVFRP